MWNKLPVQVQCMIQDARGWSTGITQRDGMGKEAGGGLRMGNTCTPMADLCWCIAKPIQYCKVKIIIIIIKKEIAGWRSPSQPVREAMLGKTKEPDLQSTTLHTHEQRHPYPPSCQGHFLHEWSLSKRGWRTAQSSPVQIANPQNCEQINNCWHKPLSFGKTYLCSKC